MLKRILLVPSILLTYPFAQDFTYCAQPIAKKNANMNIKGYFWTEKMSKVTIDIEWKHHPTTQDSFFIATPGIENLLYITTGDYRFVKYMNTGAKRQIGARQMRENIGETPMKFDDLELLANGWFKCPDSTSTDSRILTTAFPETQAVLTLDTLPTPKSINVTRWNDNRFYLFGDWIDIAGNLMPDRVAVAGRGFSGTIYFSAVHASDNH